MLKAKVQDSVINERIGISEHFCLRYINNSVVISPCGEKKSEFPKGHPKVKEYVLACGKLWENCGKELQTLGKLWGMVGGLFLEK